MKTPKTKSISELKGIFDFAKKLAASNPDKAVQLDNVDPTAISQTSSINYPWRAIGMVFVGQNSNEPYGSSYVDHWHGVVFSGKIGQNDLSSVALLHLSVINVDG